MARPLKLGMVGGGQGAFIGAVHRMAARLDGHWEIVAGALASTPERALASGQELGLAADRNYADFMAMAAAEAAREDGIDAVSIVTPNHVHFPAAKAFLEAGIPVICDKPLTGTGDDARALADIASRTGTAFVLTHNYTGYPMVRQAREMIERGDLGELRLIHVEYVQDWLSEDVESEGVKQAAWRTDPAQSGAGGAIGDIGSHAFNLVSFTTQKQVERLSAQLHSFVDGRRLDDNAHVMLDYSGGTKGVLLATQVAPGYENELRLRVSGTKGSIEWNQSSSNILRFAALGEAPQIITRGGAGAGEMAAAASRIPGGHPEGYLEAFATLYSEAAILIRGGSAPLLPTVQDGVDGVSFIEACVASSQEDGAWRTL
ncbi:Gfo/Idh/MocA family oxidoreductase [Alphaproteobacteria bacterium]|nr:Gfo/Idh/MocA family oxidoreductase [Alphaproteobacteria bacterium]